jgi:hypothetical protein
VARRISRNQNWIWANHGAVFACFGQEPHGAYPGDGVSGPGVTGGPQYLAVAYFACPNRSATGSDSVRVCGYVKTSGASINARVVLHQLLPGQTVATPDTPVDFSAPITTIGADIFFDFTARVRSGSDPLRFDLALLSEPGSVGTIQIQTVTVTWARNPASVLGETVAAWEALSQGYVQPDRPVSAALLRAISNQTLKLVADNPRPIFTHSFIWPRISTAAVGAETRVALYTLRHDGLTTDPRLRLAIVELLTGQNAARTLRVYMNGVLWYEHPGIGLPQLVSGAYTTMDVAWSGGNYTSSPGGDVKVEITLQCTGAAVGAPSYSSHVGNALLGVTLWQAPRDATTLALPGSETVPAAYQPLDDNAVAPGRSVVAQNDRLGRRAGLYYLVRNLIWLAANRTAHTLIADWTHRTQTGGWGSLMVSASPATGDGYYRNQTLFPKDRFTNGEASPLNRDVVPWADRADPTNTYQISAGGHHYAGDVLGRFCCRPLNGGKVAAILRPDVLYPTAEVLLGGSEDALLRGYFGATKGLECEPRSENLVGGFLSAQPLGPKPSAGDVLSFRADRRTTPAWWTDQRTWGVVGQQIALLSGYVYEAPLTQDDLDALP